MKKQYNEDGVVHLLAILLIVAVLGVTGFAGYKVMQSSKKDDPAASSNKNEETTSKAVWTKGGFAIEGTYADADIVQVNDTTWRLYYAIQPEVKGHNFEVYSATSSDGKTWKQDSGTRKTMATFPEIVKLADGRYRMYYQTAGVIKSAISSDGLSFTDESGTRVDTSNDASLTFDNVAAPSVALKDDGTFIMVYRGTINERYATNTPNQTTQVLMWATSADGLSFTQKGIAVDSRNTTLAGQLDGPDVVKFDDGYRVFATSYTGVYSFNFDGTTFAEAELAFAGEAKKVGDNYMGQPPGDPTTAKINGTWFMYYGATGKSTGIHYATLQ
ncbi:MAG TPA: hypothetical protein VIS56_00095 [Candidatus Saccharimonadales bacterium]